MTDTEQQLSRRENSRLEVDDRYHCKWCGGELPKMLVRGPIAGDGTEHPPVELCGCCQGRHLKLKVKAIGEVQEDYGVTISVDALDVPPESWEHSLGLWYSWSAEVQAQWIQEESE